MSPINFRDRTAGVDPRQLRALLAVVELGSFREAATRLGYAQSAVSHQVASLERSLGARLIERSAGRRQVTATVAGELAVEHARRLLDGFDALAADFDAQSRGDVGLVRVGVFQTAAFLLAQPLGRFHAAHPTVRLQLVEEEQDVLRALVRDGELDLAFDCDGEEDDEIALTPLVEDPWVVVTRVGGHFGQRTYLDPNDLDGRPLVAWEAPDQARLEATFAGMGVRPTVIFRTNDHVALTRFVAAGIGNACMGSLLGGTLLDPTLLCLPLRGRVRARSISLATARRRTLPPAAANLRAQILGDHGRPDAD